MPIIGVIASSIAKSSAENSATLFTYNTGLGFTTTNGTTWTSFNATPAIASDLTYLNIVASANNRVFVQAYGNYMYSTDGTTYTSVGTNYLFYNIRYLNGAYWTANQNLATSTDGVTWTFPTVGKYTAFNAIAYGNSTYVAGGHDGTQAYVYTSTNGVTWTSRNAPNMYIYTLIYGTNFVAAGYDNSSSIGGRTAYSTDGITWSAVNSTGLVNPSGWIYSMAYGNGRYVTTAYNSNSVNTSTDGITWTSRALGTSPNETNWGNIVYGERFVAGTNANNGILVTSTDGVTWTQRNTGFNSATYALAYAHSKYYAMMANPQGSVGSKSMAITSTDSITWTTWSGGRLGGWTSGNNMVKWQNTYYLTSDYPTDGWLWISTNGQTWTTRTVFPTPDGGGSYKNLFISSSLWLCGTTGGLLASSTNGITWTSRTNPNAGATIYSITGDDTITNKYIATQNSGRILRSTDGITWTSTTTTPARAWVNSTRAFGLYIAVGTGGDIVTSTDAVTWTSRVSGVASQLSAIASNGTIVVAGGSSGVLTTSTDGITWTSRTTGVAGAITNFKWTTFGWITNILSTISTAQYAEYLTSTDGITWTSRQFTNLAGNSNQVAFALA